MLPVNFKSKRGLSCFLLLSGALFLQAGDRNFPSPPPAFTHPRVFCNAKELPEIEKRLNDDRYKKVGDWLHAISREGVGNTKTFVELSNYNFTVTNVANSAIEKHFIVDAFRSYEWGVMALWAKIYTPGEKRYVTNLKEVMIKSAVNYARMYIFTEIRYRTNNYSGLSDLSQERIKAYWGKRTTYEVALPFIQQAGGVGIALVYDMLYADMDNGQRNDLRKCMELATKGWKVFGYDQEPVGQNGNAISNHYGYSGEVAVMLAAIYREPGFDNNSWNQIRTVLKNYVKVGYTNQGYCLEDSYGPNLGLREGIRGLIAMAYNGDNYFRSNRSQMVEIPKFIGYDAEAIPNGVMMGGESGGNDSFPSDTDVGLFYPSSIIGLKYVYKDEPIVDFAYRWRMGSDYLRRNKAQSLIEYAYFGGASTDGNNTLEGKGASKVKYYPQRGRVVIRNDFSESATQFVFDARPDAFNIGHDKAGRGYIILNALGKRWISHYNFRNVRLGNESSTVCIDGKGQAYKSPSVKMVQNPVDSNGIVSASADLKYAYDWQWSEPWTNSAEQKPRPSAGDWQQERINPRSFYLSGQHPSWVPTSLWNQTNIGYRGMWMWKRPNQIVEKAFRTVCYGKSQFPYIIVADDIKKDNNEHTYDSYFQLPNSIDRMSASGNDAILWSSNDRENRRLLVRVLQGEASSGGVSFLNNLYKTSITNQQARRLRVRLKARDPKLKILFWPHYAGMTKPQTRWNSAKTQLSVSGPGITSNTINVRNSSGRTTFAATGGQATPPPLTVGGGLRNIPAKFESEDYTAFLDRDTGNRGGEYRNDNVDIEITRDTGGGHNIGWIQNGERLEYRFNIPNAGKYDLHARVASRSSSSGKIVWTMNGATLGTLDVPVTGGWQTWRTVSLKNIQLNRADTRTLRTTFLNGGFNINWIEITRASEAASSSSGSNIASSAVVRASSEFNNSSFKASNVVDGVYGDSNRGEWAAKGEPNPWIELEFLTAKNILGVEIFDRTASERIMRGEFQYFNASGNRFTSFNFSGGLDATGKTGRRWNHTRDGVKKIRFKVLESSGSNPGLGEFKVYRK